MRNVHCVLIAVSLILIVGCSPSPIISKPTPAASTTLAVLITPSLTPTPVPTSAPLTPTSEFAVPNSPTPNSPAFRVAHTTFKGEAPCPDSDFSCITLNVPLDHFDQNNQQTIDVVFGIKRTTGKRKGMFVTATGGPGSSGVLSADLYTENFDPAIAEHFDIVFFDQRGVGQSGGLQCAQAVATYYQTDARARTPAQEAAVIAAARTFADDCLREMKLGSADELRFISTRQAVEDLEAFRQYIGDDKIWLYGESYGTQFAQTYAAAHPDRLAGLILDGAVDLTLSSMEFLAQQTRAFSGVLLMTLQACNMDLACRSDMGGDAIAVYDRLTDRLNRAPIDFKYPLAEGRTVTRSFTLPQFENAVTYNLYDENARVDLLKALAAANRNDVEPLARLAYEALGLDPETLTAAVDPSFSDAVYYAVECNDYMLFADKATPDERAQAYLRAGDPIEASVPRLSSIFYGDMPCVFWPAQPDERPAPLKAEGIPTLVLGATADPATPVSNGEAIYRRLADGYLITTQGGSHVIFGYGNECPDQIVTAFLVDDRRPAQRETTCEGTVIGEYVVDK